MAPGLVCAPERGALCGRTSPSSRATLHDRALWRRGRLTDDQSMEFVPANDDVQSTASESTRLHNQKAVTNAGSDHAWPEGLTQPAAPRFPRHLSADRFRELSEPSFGDCSTLPQDTRPLPSVVFCNGYAQPGKVLSPRLRLPEKIFFYVRRSALRHPSWIAILRRAE